MSGKHAENKQYPYETWDDEGTGRAAVQYPESKPSDPPKKRRVFWWIFLAIQVLFIVWLVTGINAAQTSPNEGLPAQEYQDAKDAGTAIGASLIVFVWAAVDFIVGGTYAIYRLVTRTK